MRPYRTRPLIVSLLACILSSGCAFTTAHLTLDYQPTPDRKSPLSTIPPRVVALNMIDLAREVEINRVRQPVGDDRRFQGDDRQIQGACPGHLGG